MNLYIYAYICICVLICTDDDRMELCYKCCVLSQLGELRVYYFICEFARCVTVNSYSDYRLGCLGIALSSELVQDRVLG